MTDKTKSDKSVKAEVKSENQWTLIAKRFFSNPLAMGSLVVFVGIWLFSVVMVGLGPIPGIWDLNYSTPYTQVAPNGAPVAEHPFGQTTIGQDYFAMTMRGVQNSYFVMIVIGGLGTIVGTVIGALAGYYRGWVDSFLMRMTDVFIVIPALVVGAVIGRISGGLGIYLLAICLGLVTWMGIARLVRGEFLTLREREFVDAARIAGATDRRIIFKHILPNAVGVVIVASTLLAASAILLETSLSYLGYGILPPEVSLGRLISDNQSAFSNRPWLYWWPALFIVVPALAINFVGDGLREAFDPRQKRFSRRRTKELPESA
ncbi:ABC transporter permease [Agrococcus casei]|nr:ABC transporter permease [Agrococcus casei]